MEVVVLPAPLVEGAVVGGHPAVQEGVVVEEAGHLQGVGVEGVLQEGAGHLREAVEEINMLKICNTTISVIKMYVRYICSSLCHTCTYTSIDLH